VPFRPVARTMSNHEEVSSAPMIARGLSPPRLLGGLVVALIATSWAGAPGVQAIEPPGPGPLDRPLVDVALVRSGDLPDLPPRLLTLDTVGLPSGSVRIALLDRSIDWLPVAEETVALHDPGDGAETPWLVDLGSGRFVVLSTSHDQGQTTLLGVEVQRGAEPSIELGAVMPQAIAVDDAGASDVDGDGSTELVIASATTTRGGGTCQSSEIRVLDATTLDQRAQYPVPDLRLAGGVLGEWDGRPGGDLLAYAYANCPAGPDSAQRLGLLAISLRDGRPTVVISPGDPSGSLPLPGVPLAADLDGDGRDEAVIRDADSLAIVEPARGWTRTDIAIGDASAIAVVGADGTDQPGSLAWLELGEGSDLEFALGTVERSDDGRLHPNPTRLDLATATRAERGRVVQAYVDASIAQTRPQAWVGDIDADGCPEILAPLLIAECASDDEPSMRVGAAWMATRPIAVFDARNRRELLVAATVQWHPTEGPPRAATPSASDDAGAWRHGPSVQFVLSEVRAADAVYFSNFPVPRPTIERGPVQAQATDLPGFTGVRVVVRAVAIGPDAPPDRDAPTLDAFMRDPVAPREWVGVARIPVPPGAESGRDGSFLRLALGDLESPDGLAPSRWIVTIAQINDWGELSGPVRQTLELDADGPSLVVEIPFLSAPWPLEATIHGRSEPQVTIVGGSAGPVVADRRGRFELRTQLAPWPQALELTAVDETGNRTSKRFTMVGGVDYRSFPWAAILAVALLLGAILSAGRGTPKTGELETLPDAEPLPEIEELPTAREWPRA
jgi:hypothetical protein